MGKDLTKLNKYNIEQHIEACKDTRQIKITPISSFFSKKTKLVFGI